ncbi:uncharacterized protein LOC113315679 [Papaver somniferum]|uniref:uncharacterized protein LOC113315679 n=1 Tax=Papaver somniferum TaxID=3469 RepID=UPI000E700425|nr:uncharacterized protein LOC113315679 [Papaver somniferum]
MENDLISNEGSWILNFTRNLNEQEMLEVENLLQVIGDPSRLSNEDSRPWRYGEGFSVANAYVALETGSLLSFPANQLWNSNVPLKVSFLVWTLCFSGAPTFDYLHNAGLIQDPKCVLCDECLETNEHFFLHCNLVFKIWSYFLKRFEINWVLSRNVKTNLWEWGDKCQRRSRNKKKKIWSILPFSIWWCIWTERNARVHNNLLKDLDQLITDVKCLMFNWGLKSQLFP